MDSEINRHQSNNHSQNLKKTKTVRVGPLTFLPLSEHVSRALELSDSDLVELTITGNTLSVKKVEANGGR